MKETTHRPHRQRRLSDDEIALWTEVARGVERRRGAALPTPSNPRAGEPAAAPAPVASEAPPSPPSKRPAIDAALDLHGLTQAEAHQALRGFLRHSQARGARLVIVVTGKGGPLGETGSWTSERGVLRRLVPHWLRETDLRSIVLGFDDAGRAHGGSGALYVRLRRLQDRSRE